ncbi:MAG: divalent-cation tolerance protein CutA [Methanothrix sp.]|nr:divalent-cation tolerance protein CutA [Methanothrix sp.]
MSEREDGFVVVFCTAGPGEAEPLASALVEERLAACVNISPVRSCYFWEGKLNCDEEVLLIIKTKKSQFEPLQKRILELHSYAVPEIIALPIIEGHQPYLDWVAQSVG